VKYTFDTPERNAPVAELCRKEPNGQNKCIQVGEAFVNLNTVTVVLNHEKPGSACVEAAVYGYAGQSME
jgi:hypothetical protein